MFKNGPYLAWGDSSVGKVIAVQAGRPNVKPQKKPAEVMSSYNPSMEEKETDPRYLLVSRPSTHRKIQASERPCLKKTPEDGLWPAHMLSHMHVHPHKHTRTHTYTYTHTPHMYVHMHTNRSDLF